MPDPVTGLDLTDPAACAAGWTRRRDIRWRALELGAFHGHPAVQHLLDRDTGLGGFPAPPQQPRGLRISGFTASLLTAGGVVGILAVLFLPLLAASLPWSSRYDQPGGIIGEPASAVPVASGMLLVFVLLVLGVRAVGWVLPGGPIAAVAVVGGVPATLNALIAGGPGDVALRPLHAAVAATVVTLGLVVWRRGRRTGPVRDDRTRAPLLPPDLRATHRHLEPALREIAALTPEQRAAAQERLRPALQDLHARGLVTDAEAQRALAAPPGLLAAVMPNLRRVARGGRE